MTTPVFDAMETTEYRIVCAHFPASGHGQHFKDKRSEDAARQAKIDNDHHAEMMSARQSRHWYALEAPFRIQTRTVSEWRDIDDE